MKGSHKNEKDRVLVKGFVVEPGMRIAQGIVAKYEHVEFKEVSKLTETNRSNGGFGSTGLK